MSLKFEVSMRVSKPVHAVFEAVADPAKLSGYFTTGGAVGRLETGSTVQWEFADFPGPFPVEVVEVVQDDDDGAPALGVQPAHQLQDVDLVGVGLRLGF